MKFLPLDLVMAGRLHSHSRLFTEQNLSLVFLKDQVWTPGLQRTVRSGHWYELVILVDYNNGVKYKLCADNK